MSKISLYSQKGFMLTKEGEYYVTLDVEFKITKTGVEKGEEKFLLEILSAAINKDERFVLKMVPLLNTESLGLLYNHVHELLKLDVADELYNYFYRGTIQPAS